MKQTEESKSKKRRNMWSKIISITMLVMMLASIIISLVLSILPNF